jgi:hypothetical protein
MKIQTAYPIIINKKRVNPKDYYLNANDTPATTPTQALVDENKKKGLTWDKAKGIWVKASESGIIDSVLDIFGIKKDTPTPKPVEVTTTKKDEGMSKNTKMIIVVGALVLIGIIYYKSKKAK